MPCHGYSQFYGHDLVIGDSVDEFHSGQGDIKYFPGATGGWYELAVALGLIAFPVSVIASGIANWITASLSNDKGNAVRLKMIIRKGDLSVDIDLSNVDEDTIIDTLCEAIDSVNTQ